jgi:hypothetical protein
MRTTELNERTIQQRLGSQSPLFMDEVLPRLMDASVVEEVTYRGRGNQRRWRLALPLSEVKDAMEGCKGNFERFLEIVTARNRTG